MNDKPMMKCGCAANATSRGKPSCVIHDCFEVSDTPPDLSNRMARCYCSRDAVQSSPNLPFFEYRGEGSRYATTLCKCGYNIVAHDKKKTDPQSVTSKVCNDFFARGPHKFDSYYCGHAGWD